MASRSGRSSRSTLMLTNPAFMTEAVCGSSNDSRSITWHQWQAEYPIDSRMGLSSALARSIASGPHGYQSTGLCACCSRYGLVSVARRLARRLIMAVSGSRDDLQDIRRALQDVAPEGRCFQRTAMVADI